MKGKTENEKIVSKYMADAKLKVPLCTHVRRCFHAEYMETHMSRVLHTAIEQVQTLSH